MVAVSLKKEKELKKIGYDHVLSLNDPNIENNILDATDGVGFDLAYDCVGGEHFYKLVNTVKARGLIVNYGNLDEEGFTPGNGLKRNNLSVGGRAQLSNKFTVQGSMNYSNTSFVSPPVAASRGNGTLGWSTFGNVFFLSLIHI